MILDKAVVIVPELPTIACGMNSLVNRLLTNTVLHISRLRAHREYSMSSSIALHTSINPLI